MSAWIRQINPAKSSMPRIFIKAKPRAFEEKVVKIDETHFEVSVREPPEKGLANLAIVAALAKFLSVPQKSVRIVSGFSSRKKTVIF